MIYNKKLKKGFTKKIGIIISACLCILFVSAAALITYLNMNTTKQVVAPFNREAAKMHKETVIARARQSIKQGEQIKPEKAELVQVPEELVPEGAITNLSKLNNMRLKHDVAAKEFVIAADLLPDGVLFEEDERLIEHNFAEGVVPEAVLEGSLIDIKLFLKGGEDRFVISKVPVASRNGNLLAFYMNKREQELLKEAAAEGNLIVVKYLDAGQIPSDVTYVPLHEKGKLQ